MIRNAEEIRVRCLVANRTGETALIKNVDPIMQFAGLYPNVMRVDENNEIIDEFKTKDFKEYCEKFPDIQRALTKHNLI